MANDLWPFSIGFVLALFCRRRLLSLRFTGHWPLFSRHSPPFRASAQELGLFCIKKPESIRNDSPNPLRSSLCLVISYRCICVFFCIAGTAYRSDLLCGKDVKDGGPCPPYENSFGPGLRTYVESGDCTNGLGESLRLGAVGRRVRWFAGAFLVRRLLRIEHRRLEIRFFLHGLTGLHVQ